LRKILPLERLPCLVKNAAIAVILTLDAAAGVCLTGFQRLCRVISDTLTGYMNLTKPDSQGQSALSTTNRRALSRFNRHQHATFGGVSGVLFGAFQGFISPESFTLMESVMIVAMVVLGGVGHLPGVVLGAVLLSALPEVLRFVAGPLQAAILKCPPCTEYTLYPSFEHCRKLVPPYGCNDDDSFAPLNSPLLSKHVRRHWLR
jgi:hypothetical protein